LFVRKSVFKEILKIYFQTLFKMWNGHKIEFQNVKMDFFHLIKINLLPVMSVDWKTEQTSKHLIKMNQVCIRMISLSVRLPMLPMVTSSKCISLLWSLHQNATKLKISFDILKSEKGGKLDCWSKCFDQLKTWKHFKKMFWRSVTRSFNNSLSILKRKFGEF
jgi:hypothetical protein